MAAPDVSCVMRSSAKESTRTQGCRSPRVSISLAIAVKSAATPETIRGYAAASQLEDWDLALLGIIRDAGANALPESVAAIVDRAGAPIPTLILWGSEDSWVPLSAGEALRDALPSATYVVLPGLGHVPFEEDPEEFTQAMQEWLAALK